MQLEHPVPLELRTVRLYIGAVRCSPVQIHHCQVDSAALPFYSMRSFSLRRKDAYYASFRPLTFRILRVKDLPTAKAFCTHPIAFRFRSIFHILPFLNPTFFCCFFFRVRFNSIHGPIIPIYGIRPFLANKYIHD